MIDSRNVVLTGVPRSGTTLTCSLLNKLPDTVALHEPMRGKHVRPTNLTPQQRVAIVAGFFAEQRASLLGAGQASSRTLNGEMPVNPFGAERTADGLRKHLDQQGTVTIDKPLSPDFTLILKHLGSFAALSDALQTQFLVVSVVRNPLAALASWSTLDAPLRDGHLGVAEKLDPALAAVIAAAPDAIARQLILLDWFFARSVDFLPAANIIRYEDLIASNGHALTAITPAAAALDERLGSKNSNELYAHAAMLEIGERMLASDGAYWQLYTRADVETLMSDIAAKLPAVTTAAAAE